MKTFLRTYKFDTRGIIAFVFAGALGMMSMVTLGGIEYTKIVAEKTNMHAVGNRVALEIIEADTENHEKLHNMAEKDVYSTLTNNNKLKNVKVLTNIREDAVEIVISADAKTFGAHFSDITNIRLKTRSVAQRQYPEVDVHIVYDNSLSMSLAMEDVETPLTEYDNGEKCYFACHMDDNAPIYTPSYVSKHNALQAALPHMLSILREYDQQDHIRSAMSKFSHDLIEEYDIESYLHKQGGVPDLDAPSGIAPTDIQTSLSTLLQNINTTDEKKDIVVLISDGDNRQTFQEYSSSSCNALHDNNVEVYTFHLPVTLRQYTNRDAMQEDPWMPGEIYPYYYDEEIIEDKVDYGIHFNGTIQAKNLMQECATTKRHYQKIKTSEEMEEAFEKIFRNTMQKYVILMTPAPL